MKALASAEVKKSGIYNKLTIAQKRLGQVKLNLISCRDN